MYLKKNVYDGCRNSQKDSDREGELMMEGILVCDDDQEIVQAIEIYLSQEGYEVYQAHDGLEALKVLQEKKVQLIIMDIMMPRLDGIRATLKIREQNAVPIIILSAKSEDADKILGLNIGADDYLTKPFNPLELVARVKSQLRRYTRLGASPELGRIGIYETGGLVVDDERKEVTLDGQMIRMTPIEYQILLLLIKNKGRVFSTSQIYEYIWKEDAIGAESTVAVHIRHIREKIEINPREPRYLKVVWGVGYKIEVL
jgi:DNA-binding response OmpR family regulator